MVNLAYHLCSSRRSGGRRHRCSAAGGGRALMCPKRRPRQPCLTMPACCPNHSLSERSVGLPGMLQLAARSQGGASSPLPPPMYGGGGQRTCAAWACTLQQHWSGLSDVGDSKMTSNGHSMLVILNVLPGILLKCLPLSPQLATTAGAACSPIPHLPMPPIWAGPAQPDGGDSEADARSALLWAIPTLDPPREVQLLIFAWPAPVPVFVQPASVE